MNKQMIKSKLVLKDIYTRRAEEVVKQEKKAVANAKRKATIAAKSPEVLAAEKFKRDENRRVKDEEKKRLRRLEWIVEQKEYELFQIVRDIKYSLEWIDDDEFFYNRDLDNICHKVDFAVWGLDNRQEYEYILQQRKEIIEEIERVKAEKEVVDAESIRLMYAASYGDNDHGWGRRSLSHGEY